MQRLDPDVVDYLHIRDNIAAELNNDQRLLLLEAIRFDKAPCFSAGATITRLFTRAELEGHKQGAILYA